MKEKMIHLIAQEDKRKPYTDEQLANLLGVKREQVTLLRRQADILDSRERRKPLLLKAMDELLKEHGDVSERDLTYMLLSKGFTVSRFSVRQYRQELLPQKDKKTPLKKNVPLQEQSSRTSLMDEEKDAFSHLIGCQGSLKPVIEQAKAAVFYPPKGLHTLILGETGVGKSDLAQAMYQFAKLVQRIPANIPFVFFNCADYVNNSQLLMAQLFGYSKGAFTGAEADKAGLVEKANQGILFLDEIHRLPPEGQELLFYIMDKGIFRRLGETDMLRQAEVMIIAATTEKPESALLGTFRRRIPMVIEIPPISIRPLSERFALIQEFFRKEAHRIMSAIEVSQEAVRALLLFDCPGNIGQLLSVIQVACAKAFLSHVIHQAECIKITVEDLPVQVRNGLLKMKNRVEIEELVSDTLLVTPDHPSIQATGENLYTLPGEIYEYIEKRYQELQRKDMGAAIINHIIGNELENRFKTMVKHIGSHARPLSKEDLVKIVGKQVFCLCEKMQQLVEQKMKITEKGLFFCLAVHIRTTLDRLKEGKKIINPHLAAIKKEYAQEYRIAREMTALLEEALKVPLPEDETGFLAMYLANFASNGPYLQQGRIGVVILSHGHVAQGMAEVANRLLGICHARYVEMSLDESPEAALERAMEAAKDADEGKGVLLLVDMGSLVTFGELITQRTGIKTRVISRVDTVLTIDMVRKAAFQGMSLDELVASVEESPRYISRLTKGEMLEFQPKSKVIITLCVTGEGSAVKVKELLENALLELKNQVEFIMLGALCENLPGLISDIGKTKEILAVVGTINPGLKNHLFIPMEDIVSGLGIARIKALCPSSLLQEKKIEEEGLAQTLMPELMVLEPEVDDKEAVLALMADRLFREGYTKEEFIKGIRLREEIGTTYIGKGFALPHTDPSYVLKPGVAIAKLKQPVDWGGKPVSVVFMLALTVSCHKLVQEVYGLTTKEEFFTALQLVKNEQEMWAVAYKYLQ